MASRTQRFYSLVRTTHIYLTLLVLAVLVLISITGFALNHESWFGLDNPRVTTEKAAIPPELLRGPDKLALVEYLRNHCGASGPVETFELTDDPVVVAFRSPGRSVDVTIEKAGAAVVRTESSGFLGRLADLHRGKHVPLAWRVLLDVGAGGMFLGALTGAVLLFSLPLRRKLGVLAVAGGVVGAVVLYWLAVS